MDDAPPGRDELSPADDVTGRTIGTYRIESHLGSGGMGEVYRAYDTNLDRPVALKLLPAAVAADADRLRRFRAEARQRGRCAGLHVARSEKRRL